MRRFERTRRRAFGAVAVVAPLSILLWYFTCLETYENRELRLRISPDTLAHFLADFSNEQKLDDRITQWNVVEESRGGGEWRYRVRYLMADESCDTSVVAAVHAPYSVRTKRLCCDAAFSALCWREECRAEVTRERAAPGISVYTKKCAFSCGIGARLNGQCGAAALRRGERDARLLALITEI